MTETFTRGEVGFFFGGGVCTGLFNELCNQGGTKIDPGANELQYQQKEWPKVMPLGL